MTLFTKKDCKLCDQIKQNFDLEAMQIKIEVLDNSNADALAHLAWHGLVETARKTLPILVLDDSSSEDNFMRINDHLQIKAGACGLLTGRQKPPIHCENGSCAMN